MKKSLLVVSILVMHLMVNPCFAIEFGGAILGEAGNYEGSFWLDDVPEPLITAAMMIEFDPTVLTVAGVTFNDAWDQGMSSGNPVDKEPGKYVLIVGNLSVNEIVCLDAQ